MLQTIQNDSFICTIESVGAEVRSLREKSTGKEFIWQINDSIWGSSSPVLFPAIGSIYGGKISHNGADYAITKHGIIRNNEHLEFEQISRSKCSFTLNSSEETKKQYPFDFSFSVIYELIENRLIMTYDIQNNSEEFMLFACGGHTAYSIPLNESTKLSDYVVEFPDQTHLEADTLGDSGFLSYKKRNYPLENNSLELSDSIFNDDALIFTDINFDWVRLRKRTDKNGVIVRFSGYPNLALWSKPGADYICIEPWLGLPDREDESMELSRKTSYHKLQSSDKFSISIETKIE